MEIDIDPTDEFKAKTKAWADNDELDDKQKRFVTNIEKHAANPKPLYKTHKKEIRAQVGDYKVSL